MCSGRSKGSDKRPPYLSKGKKGCQKRFPKVCIFFEFYSLMQYFLISCFSHSRSQKYDQPIKIIESNNFISGQFKRSPRWKTCIFSLTISIWWILSVRMACLLWCWFKWSSWAEAMNTVTCLQCVFSYVSSKCLHVKMHSHIGCIYTVFFHCVS